MKPSQASSQRFTTLREAIHHTATTSGIPMKAIAAELDYSPSDLSMRTTLGDDGRGLPADKLIRLMEATNNFSVLYTLAEALGFEVHQKRDHLPEILESIALKQADLSRQFEQLRLMVPLADSVSVNGKR